MNLTIHIGTHRTGTTSIQQALAEAPIHERGILYPKTGRDFNAHHRLAQAIVGLWEQPLGLWDDMWREVENAGLPQVLLSSEDFSWADDKKVEVLSRMLPDGPRRVIVFLRNPLEFLRSMYVITVKLWNYKHGFDRFIEENWQRCDYAALIERWQTIGAVTPIVYSSQDVVPDFFQEIGVPGPGKLYSLNAAEQKPVVRPYHIRRLRKLTEGFQQALEPYVGDCDRWFMEF